MERDDFANAMDPSPLESTGTRRTLVLRNITRNGIRRWGAIGAIVLSLWNGGAWGQSGDLRSSFPGRRVGGGTRGDCTSRLLAHLVPTDSVYTPDSQGLVGILQGPAGEPRPVELSLRPYGDSSGSGDAVQPRNLSLPAAPVGVILLRLPAVTQPTVWESKYRCEEPTPDNGDPLSFVVSTVPPVVSLLMKPEGPTPADRSVQGQLDGLRARCGGTVSTAALAKAFGMEDLVAANWPAELPVRCPAAAALP